MLAGQEEGTAVGLVVKCGVGATGRFPQSGMAVTKAKAGHSWCRGLVSPLLSAMAQALSQAKGRGSIPMRGLRPGAGPPHLCKLLGGGAVGSVPPCLTVPSCPRSSLKESGQLWLDAYLHQ